LPKPQAKTDPDAAAAILSQKESNSSFIPDKALLFVNRAKDPSAATLPHTGSLNESGLHSNILS